MVPKARGGVADADADCSAFLFTSLQGLDHLAATASDAAVLALALDFHHLVMAQCIAHRGIAWSTAADSVFAGFSDTTQALQAALAVQQALRVHNGEHQRSPMHAGIAVDALEAGESGSDGLSTIVKRTARSAAMAHASQVIVSEVAYRTVRGVGVFQVRALERAQYLGARERGRRQYEVLGARSPQAQSLWNDVRRLNLASLLHRGASASLLTMLTDVRERLAGLATEKPG